MKNEFEETDLGAIKPIPIAGRRSKVTVDQIVDPARTLGEDRRVNADGLLALLPDVLAADSLKKLTAALKEARSKRREIVWLVGAHTIKCGLSLYLNALIDEGFITTIGTTQIRSEIVYSGSGRAFIGQPPQGFHTTPYR